MLVTGHTGFKGAWLCEWLLQLGAHPIGIALPPDTEPALFTALGLAERMDHRILDIRDAPALTQTVLEAAPDYVFHLAAQAQVRRSYRVPVDTFATNLMGTVHVLEALRTLQARYAQAHRHCAAVLVTTDKCYENREWLHAYREDDALGGHDPYSASKAACELAISAYRRSYFDSHADADACTIGVASARAGNVIGGGDWAADRIVPDCIRSLMRREPIQLRSPHATRPWQHVLEPLHGYLLLGLLLHEALRAADTRALADYADAFNFGPPLDSNRTVRELVETIVAHWPGDWQQARDAAAPHEAGRLNVAWDKAFHRLGWSPRWDFARSVHRAVTWYRAYAHDNASAIDLVVSDIAAYSDAPTRHQDLPQDSADIQPNEAS